MTLHPAEAMPRRRAPWICLGPPQAILDDIAQRSRDYMAQFDALPAEARALVADTGDLAAGLRLATEIAEREAAAAVGTCGLVRMRPRLPRHSR